MIKKIFYGWIIVASCTLLLATAYGISFSFSVFFSSLQSEFAWSRATTSSLFSLYLLLTGVFSIIGGRYSDKYGPKVVIMALGVVSGLSLVLTSQVTSAWQLFLTYSVLLSLGAGAMYIIVMSTGSRWFLQKRATALGIIGAGANLGTVIIAPVCAWMIHSYHWRSAYMIMGIVAWLIILPVALLLKKDPSEIGANIDGNPVLKGTDLDNTHAAGDFSLGEALKTRNFWLFFLIWFCYSFCLHLVISHMVPRAEDTGMTPLRAAAVLSLLQAVAIPSRLVFGFIADKVDKRTIAIVFALIITLTMFWLVAADVAWMFYLFAVVYGLSYGGIDPPVIALVGDVFGLKKVGAIMGILMISWGLGSATGPYFGGLIFDYTGRYHLAFFSGGLIMTLAAVFMSRVHIDKKL